MCFVDSGLVRYERRSCLPIYLLVYGLISYKNYLILVF